jgi:hypothetical protein
MPFTLFHLGPALFLGEVFKRQADLISILLGSIIVDVRAAYCLFAGCRPLHGPLHTFLGATLIALLLAWVVFSHRIRLQRVTDRIRIRQAHSFMPVLAGSLIGTWSHVLLDSFLYMDIMPLWPLTSNPLLGMLDPGTVYLMCLLFFLPAAGSYCYRYWKTG